MKMTFSKASKLVTVFAATVLCSQGVLAQQDYEPDPEKLDNKAGNSKQLYIEPDFNFNSHRSVVIDLIALNDEGLPLAQQLIFVSGRAASEDEASEEPPTYELLSIVVTDESGKVYSTLEVSDDINELSIESQILGVESAVVVDLNDTLTVNHTFQ